MYNVCTLFFWSRSIDLIMEWFVHYLCKCTNLEIVYVESTHFNTTSFIPKKIHRKSVTASDVITIY